jgi:hypothetical protein
VRWLFPASKTFFNFLTNKYYAAYGSLLRSLDRGGSFAFGAGPAQVAALVSLGRSTAVSSLINYDPADTTVDSLIAALPDTGIYPLIKNPESFRGLQAWWFFRLRHTPNPHQEQLTLMLHDLVTTEWDKVVTDLSDRVNPGNDGTDEE